MRFAKNSLVCLIVMLSATPLKANESETQKTVITADSDYSESELAKYVRACEIDRRNLSACNDSVYENSNHGFWDSAAGKVAIGAIFFVVGYQTSLIVNK